MKEIQLFFVHEWPTQENDTAIKNWQLSRFHSDTICIWLHRIGLCNVVRPR